MNRGSERAVRFSFVSRLPYCKSTRVHVLRILRTRVVYAFVVVRSRPRFRSAINRSRFSARVFSSSSDRFEYPGGGGTDVSGSVGSVARGEETNTTPVFFSGSVSNDDAERRRVTLSDAVRSAYASALAASASRTPFADIAKAASASARSSARARSATPRLRVAVATGPSVVSELHSFARSLRVPTRRTEKARRNSSASKPPEEDPFFFSRAFSKSAIVSFRRRFVSRASRSDSANGAKVSSPTPSIVSARRGSAPLLARQPSDPVSK